MSSPSANAPTILCAGIIVLDEVYRVERFPHADEKVQARGFFTVNGGCAANAAVAIVRLGGRARLAGPLGGPAGGDSNGDQVLAALARERVDCAGCRRITGATTARSAIFIDAHGERMIVTRSDARLPAAAPADPGGLVAAADAVLADNRYPEFVRPVCLAARERGLTVVLDANRPTELSDDLLRIATHVVLSSECLRATIGVDDLGAALRRPQMRAARRQRRGPAAPPRSRPCWHGTGRSGRRRRHLRRVEGHGAPHGAQAPAKSSGDTARPAAGLAR